MKGMVISMSSNAVRIGIVGIGNIGSMHLKNLYEGRVKGALVTAICEIDEKKLEKAASKYEGVKPFTSYDEMFASGEIDAVIVAVPHYNHHTVAIKAFEAGLNVLTEKPAGVRVSDVKSMIEAADKSGKAFAIMFNQRTNPLFKKARELVKGGAIGELKRLTWIITNWYRTQTYYDSGSWRATWGGEGGGVLTNQSPHNLDIAQWIFGMPSKLRAFCKEGLYHNITVEDLAVIQGEYENGATMQFITTTGEFPGSNRLEVVGEGGKLVIEDGKLKLWLLKTPEKTVRFESREGMPSIPLEYSEILPDSPETAHCGIIENFVNNILYGEELISNGREGINQVILTTASYMSSWTESWVELPFDDEKYNALLSEKCLGENADKKEGVVSESENMLPRWSVNW